MPDLFVGVLIGFVCGFAGACALARLTITRSKATRRRNLPDLSRIYDDLT